MNEQNPRPDIFDELRRHLSHQQLANLIGLDVTERNFGPVAVISMPFDLGELDVLDQLDVKIRYARSAKNQALSRNP